MLFIIYFMLTLKQILRIQKVEGSLGLEEPRGFGREPLSPDNYSHPQKSKEGRKGSLTLKHEYDPETGDMRLVPYSNP